MSETMSAASNEILDFSEDGVQPQELLFGITRAEVVTVEGGTQLEVDFQSDDQPFPRTEKYWLTHDEVPGKNWAKAVEIGRGNAKRLARAVSGGSTQLDLTTLVGKKVLATRSEDNSGFIRINRFKAAPDAEPIS
jgi:hypothetical protein